MKRGFVILILLLSMQIAYAEIGINGPQKQSFNLGDDIVISGYVQKESSFDGLFGLKLICGGQTSTIPSTSLSLTAGERKLFPTDFSIPKIISNNVEGDCYLEASLIENSVTLDTAKSTVFTITKSLKGTFKIDKEKIQSGDIFTLKGDISKLDGSSVEGSAEIYFESNDTKFLVDVVNINNGDLEYKYNALPLATNTYVIDVLVMGTFGNIQLFEDVASFNLVNDLTIDAKAERSTLRPGDELKISGNVKNIAGENVQQGSVKMLFDDSTYKTEIKDGSFERKIEISDSIRSGKHLIRLTGEDNKGNRGIIEITITIQPELNQLNIELEGSKFNPEETILINTLLYDQAGSLVEEDASIEILDPKDRKIFSEVTKIDNKLSYVIPQFAVPGSYKIIASVRDFKKEVNFEISEVLRADVSIDNQTLMVYNLGNIKYDKPIKVDIGSDRVVRRANIQPNQTEFIYLDEEFSSGNYDVTVTYGDEQKVFNNVEIIGKPKKSFNLIYVVLIVVLFGLFGYLFITKRKRAPKVRKNREKVGFHKRDVNVKSIKAEKKSLKFKFGTASEDDVKDFKKRILDDIKKVQEGNRKGESDMFGMFK